MRRALEIQEKDQSQSIPGEHFVYIVRCVDGSLYTGYAKDVARRVTMHNTGKGAKYTRSRLPVSLQASWSFHSKREALQAEYAMKRLSRAQKIVLCAQKAESDWPNPGKNDSITMIALLDERS